MVDLVKLGDVCTVYTGTGFPTQYQGETSGDYPFYKVGDISKNVTKGYVYLQECDNYISADIAKKIKGTIVPADTVVFAKIGEAVKLNRRAITVQNCLVDNNAMGICPNQEKLNLSYFYHYMCSIKLETFAEATTVPSVKKSAIENLVVPLPTYEEQTNISHVLDSVCELISQKNQQLSTLDSIVKSRFIEMFGNINNKIPISKLCDVTGGYSFKSADISSNGAIKVLQIGNVYLDNVNWETINYLPEGYDEYYSKFLLKAGDIVVALTRPIIQSLGNVKACIVKPSDLPCLLNQRVGRIVAKSEKTVFLEYIYGCLMTDDFTKYVESCSIGCSQPNISTKNIENYLIPNATYEQQKIYVEFKKQTDKLKLEVKESLGKLETLKKSLMQKYFG